MTDFIDIIIHPLMIIFSVSHYHIIYNTINTLRNKHTRYFYDINMIVLYVIYNILSFVICDFFDSMIIHFQTNLYYTTIVLVFYLINKHLFVYGLSISLFLTEYWELPIYLWRWINTGELITMNGTQQIFILSTIMMKLLVISYILYEIEILGWNKKDLFKALTPFTIGYSMITYISLSLSKMRILKISYLGWFLRFITLMFFIMFTKTQILKYHIEEYNSCEVE